MRENSLDLFYRAKFAFHDRSIRSFLYLSLSLFIFSSAFEATDKVGVVDDKSFLGSQEWQLARSLSVSLSLCLRFSPRLHLAIAVTRARLFVRVSSFLRSLVHSPVLARSLALRVRGARQTRAAGGLSSPSAPSSCLNRTNGGQIDGRVRSAGISFRLIR